MKRSLVVPRVIRSMVMAEVVLVLLLGGAFMSGPLFHPVPVLAADDYPHTPKPTPTP